ncbi:MAG TPA: porin [Polyangia bacterium]
MRFAVAASLATAIALSASTGRAQTPPPPAPPAAPTDGPADAGALEDAELEASRKAMQDLEAQVIELRRIIEAMDRSRASVDDLRRRIDDLEARLGENDRRDEALAHGGGGEASLFKFHDDGFTLRSPNGRFLMTPHLRLQTVYTGVLASKGTADDGAAPDRSGFALTHAEVILEGHVWSRMIGYRLQLDAAESPTINDAFVQLGPPRRFGVRVGQFKVPYGLQRRTYSGELEFVDISAPMAAFQLDRDVGAMIVGRPLAGRLAYEFAVLNGAGAGRLNDNIDLAYALHVAASPFGPLPPGEGDVEWHPRPRAMLGVAGYYNLVPTDIIARSGDPNANTDQDGDGRIDNVAIWQGGVELKALWRGAALQAEWFGRYEKPGGSSASRSYQGAYVQASYFVIRGRLQVAGRIAGTDQPRYGSTPTERALLGNHVNEQSAAVNAYLRGHRIKLQVDYTHSHATDHEPPGVSAVSMLPAASGPTQHRIRAALQVGF